MFFIFFLAFLFQFGFFKTAYSYPVNHGLNKPSSLPCCINDSSQSIVISKKEEDAHDYTSVYTNPDQDYFSSGTDSSAALSPYDTLSSTEADTAESSGFPTTESYSDSIDNSKNGHCKEKHWDFSSSSDISFFTPEYCGNNAKVIDGELKLSMNEECGTTLVSSQRFSSSGRVDIVMKAMPGSGSITALVFMGPNGLPKDEIDIELLGANPSQFESMFFIDGQRVTGNESAGFHSNPDNSDLTQTYHKYSIELTLDKVNWYLDDKLVRSLQKPQSDSAGSRSFPSNALNFKFGVWNGSGIPEWAGTADFSSGEKAAYIKSISMYFDCN
ncbi:hypothetical protein BB560_003277 [Smittium megazygosporum]|uniref:GH16 domain-containing protein n=1 Tax=Smittium megazygosporum TaxID=133381 RepID=A0A2T9ZCI0_9FUNG|nr:hypothetical protein BB560_003277 [Smittium megazygosporum]